jgi:hypothetical protein
VVEGLEDLQIQEVFGEGLKTMQENSACHYFVDLQGTNVGGPMLIKDDALGLAGSRDQRSPRLTSNNNQKSPRMLTNFMHDC